MKTVILVICISLIFYILYIRGIVVINSKSAVMFVGSIRGNGDCKANFVSCSGYMKRVIRFRESRRYHFSLDAELENGELEVKILNASKQPEAILNSKQRSAVIDVEKSRRYYLTVTFKSASGKYELKWDRQ